MKNTARRAHAVPLQISFPTEILRTQAEGTVPIDSKMVAPCGGAREAAFGLARPPR
jgi:hypothetical protein